MPKFRGISLYFPCFPRIYCTDQFAPDCVVSQSFCHSISMVYFRDELWVSIGGLGESLASVARRRTATNGCFRRISAPSLRRAFLNVRLRDFFEQLLQSDRPRPSLMRVIRRCLACFAALPSGV